MSLGNAAITRVENVIGSGYRESIDGDGMNNRLEGMGGNDILSGGANNDTLIGGAGDDRMSGGAHADRFVFQAVNSGSQYDTINNFQPGIDKIVIEFLPGIRFHYMVDTFDEIVRHARWVSDSPATDAAGDAGTEFRLGDDTIFVEGLSTEDLSASDFIFL